MAVPIARGLTVERLEPGRLWAEIAAPQRSRIQDLELLETVASTNSHLLARTPPAPGYAHVCLAEHQVAGRGRQGRRWVTPPGSGVTLSVGGRLESTAAHATGLSLAVGVAVVRALERAGAGGLALKWPNDVWWSGRKLGGVLVELQGDPAPLYVVIGVGLNVLLSAPARREIEASGVRVASVADACARPPSRNRVAGALIDELIALLPRFDSRGFADFHAEWSRLDALAGRRVRVLAARQTLEGRAGGVDEQGALLLDTGAGVERVVSGDVTLRLAQEAP